MHPFLVSVPIGCWSSASLLDDLGQRRSARTLIGAGVLSVIPTAIAGLSDWVDTSGAERRVGFVHLSANPVGTSMYAASWLARRAGYRVRQIVGSVDAVLDAAGKGGLLDAIDLAGGAKRVVNLVRSVRLTGAPRGCI